MTNEKKTLKFQMMMSPSEANLLDDWMFKNRVRSRAEAIRQLWQTGLKLDEVAPNIIDALQMLEDSRLRTEQDGENDIRPVTDALYQALAPLLISSLRVRSMKELNTEAESYPVVTTLWNAMIESKEEKK